MLKKSLFFLFSLCITLPALSQEAILEQHPIDVATTDGIKPLTDVGGYAMYIYTPGISTDITTFAQYLEFDVSCWVANVSGSTIQSCYFRIGLTDSSGNLKEYISDIMLASGFLSGYTIRPTLSCMIKTDNLAVGDRIYLYAQNNATDADGWVRITEVYGDATPTYIEITSIGDPLPAYNMVLSSFGLTTSVSIYYTNLFFYTDLCITSKSVINATNLYARVALTDADGNVLEWISDIIDFGTLQVNGTKVVQYAGCTLTKQLQAGYRIRAFYQVDATADDGWTWLEPESDDVPGEIVLTDDMIVNVGDKILVDGLYYNVLSDTEAEVTYATDDDEAIIPYTQTSITIPSTITRGLTFNVVGAGYWAFYGCENLTSIDLGSITYIGEQAFRDCTSLSSINLPESLVNIGDYAFSGCSALTGELVIPDGVVTLGNDAFTGCSELTSVVIGSGVTTIGASAFQFCENLSSVTFGENVVSIGGTAFASTILAGDLVIPDKVVSIADWAFSGCDRLTSLTLGSSLATIGGSAFYACDGLTYVTSLNTTPPTCGDAVFGSVETSAIPLYVPKGSKNAYSSTSPWSDFGSILELAEVGDKIYVDGLYYNVLDNNCLEVTWGGSRYTSGTPEYTGDITIPASVVYAGVTYTVTAIGDYAFYYCKSLSSITIPDSVTTIGYEAFVECNALERVDLGSGVTTIGNYAFADCFLLAEITIPDNVETIGRTAFGSCWALEKVTFGSGLKTIGDFAFQICTSLKEITIPDNVETIGECSFCYCDSLESATIGSGVKEIGASPFAVDYMLTKIEVSADNEYYCSVDNVLFTKDMTTIVQYAPGLEATSYEIPASVTTIGEWAFCGAPHLTSIDIPDNVTTMGDAVFYWCENLQTATIGNGIETLSDYTFEFCYALTNVTIGSNVATIGDYVFDDCYDLESVTSLNPTPPTCTKYTFYRVDTDNATLYVPKGRKNTYSSADYWSDFGAIVEIPAIGDKIFVDNIYYNVLSNNTVEVTHGKYQTDGTEEYTGDITIPETIVYAGITYSVVAVGDYAFCYCTELTSITIPNSVESIGEWAFDDCYALESVTLGSGLKTIKSWGFQVCYSLKEITIPDSVETIGYEAFGACFLLENVTLGNGLKTIDDIAFEWCVSLKEITIPASVTTLGAGVFGCDFSLTKLEVAADNETYCSVDNVIYTKDMTTLVAYAAGLEATSFDIPESVTTIGDSAFEGVIHLTSIDIPDNVTTLEESAFMECYNLQTLTIGNGVETIGEGAFAACFALTSVTLGSNVTTIAGWAFQSCYKVPSLTLGSRVTTIGDYAFDGWFALESVTSLNTTPPTCTKYTFYQLDTSAITLYVPAGTADLYAAADVWCDFGAILEMAEPTLTIAEATDVTYDSATLSATITEGTLPVTSCGFEYWTEDGDIITIECEGSELEATLTDLADATTYYYRAYAITDYATTYSETLSFTTLVRPDIATLPATDVTSNSATLNAEVSGGSDTTVEEYGFEYWSADDESDKKTAVLTTDVAEMSFLLTLSTTITDLAESTTYYYRAYATTEYGTTYGNEESFTTLADTSSGISGISLDSDDIEAIYSVSGQRFNDMTQRGTYIVRLKDGTTKKVYIK